MNPVQKTGLLTLGLLLVMALAGFLLGPNKADPADSEPDVAVIDIGALPGVEFVPPERRQFWIKEQDFRQPPIAHPVEGGAGPDIRDWRDIPADERGAAREAAFLPADAPPPPLPATYRVRQNDNLQKIAGKALGDSGRWREIAALNGIEAPYVVRIGDLLRLPEGPPPEPGGTSRAAAPPESGGSGAAEDPAADSGWREYVVGKNETPSDVSMAVYGTSRLWKLILEENGIKDPRDLRAGTTLRIPPRP